MTGKNGLFMTTLPSMKKPLPFASPLPANNLFFKKRPRDGQALPRAASTLSISAMVAGGKAPGNYTGARAENTSDGTSSGTNSLVIFPDKSHAEGKCNKLPCSDSSA